MNINVMVDLTLASSYIPAVVCVGKAAMCSFACVWVLSMGGLPALGILLVVDRFLFNTDYIVDVNAVVSAVSAYEVANHERGTLSMRRPVSEVASVLWCGLSLFRALRPNAVKQRPEFYAYVVLALGISVTNFQSEPVTITLLRSLSFTGTVLVQIYVHLANTQEDPLVLTLLRHGSIMVGYFPVAIFATVVFLLIQAMQCKQMEVPQTSKEDMDMEAAVLREMLASRKEKAGN